MTPQLNLRRSTLIEYRVRCDNCRWAGYRRLPRQSYGIVDLACPKCEHPAISALSPKVRRHV